MKWNPEKMTLEFEPGDSNTAPLVSIRIDTANAKLKEFFDSCGRVYSNGVIGWVDVRDYTDTHIALLVAPTEMRKETVESLFRDLIRAYDMPYGRGRQEAEAILERARKLIKETP